MENLNTNKKLNTYIDNIKKLVIENEFLKHSMNSIKANKKNNNVTINVENATPEQKEVINEFYQKDIDMLNKQLAQQNQLLQNAHQNQLPININVPSNHNLENSCNLKNREFRERMFQLNRENRIRQSELNRESRERIAELDRKMLEIKKEEVLQELNKESRKRLIEMNVKKEEFLQELNNIKKEKEKQLKELEELKTIKKNDIYNKNILNEEINYYNKLNNNIKNNKININNLLKKLKSRMENYNNNNRLNNYNLEQNKIQVPRILFVIKKKGLI